MKPSSASLAYIYSILDLNILGIFAPHVAWRGVFTNVEVRRSIAGKDVVTRRNSTTNFCRSFPHDLGEMRGHWVVGIVRRDFVSPTENTIGDSVVTGASS